MSQREQDSFPTLFWEEMLPHPLLQYFEINKEQKLFPVEIKLHSTERMQDGLFIAEEIQKTEPKKVQQLFNG